MKFLEQIGKIAHIGNTNTDLQREINVTEILGQGVKTLEQEVTDLEKILMTHGIPLPKRPPAGSDSPYKSEIITDENIYTRILGGIGSFIHLASSAFTESTSPKLRELFKTYLIKEIDLYDKFFSYGQIKGLIIEPPAYRL